MYRKQLSVRIPRPYGGSWGDGLNVVVNAVPDGHHILDLRYEVTNSTGVAPSNNFQASTSPGTVSDWNNQVKFDLITYGSPTDTIEWFDVDVDLVAVDLNTLPNE